MGDWTATAVQNVTASIRNGSFTSRTYQPHGGSTIDVCYDGIVLDIEWSDVGGLAPLFVSLVGAAKQAGLKVVVTTSGWQPYHWPNERDDIMSFMLENADIDMLSPQLYQADVKTLPNDYVQGWKDARAMVVPSILDWRVYGGGEGIAAQCSEMGIACDGYIMFGKLAK